MRSASAITFGPYRLDPTVPRLWKGEESVALQPRPLAVLSYLAGRPGQVIGRDELIRTLWAGTYVTTAVLKVAVRAVREALGDDVESPRYIETVGRQGYRFIAGDAAAGTSYGPGSALGTMVGRARDLGGLRAAFEQAAGGARRIVFVTGEGGIGKTTLIELFLADVAHHADTWVARGQCLEQYGGGEAYLPLLEAIGRLARDDGAGEVGRSLRLHAPTWVSQLPAVDADHAAGPGVATTPARMLRELADAFEVLTRARTLVLVLEDLQWSDPSTIDVIAYLARRLERARLLLIGTFRPADLIADDHPLRRVQLDLHARRQCEELALTPLSPADVRAYVDARFNAAPSDQMRRLAAHVHQRTDGNALFMVDMVNDLVAQETLVWRDGRWRVHGSLTQATGRTPPGLRELIGHRLQRLTPAMRAALEVASVVGDEFTVAAVAEALDEPPGTVEDVFEKLAAQGMLIGDAGVAESSDGTLAGRYRFLHGLYRHVLYEGVGAARRMRLHRAIGLREEEASGGGVPGRAAELAMHFERGGDHRRALRYHEMAGSAALERHAAHEAAGHFAAALEALAREQPAPDRDDRELSLAVSRATLLMATHGYGSPETEQAFARARSLCDALPSSPRIHPVLRGLVSYRQVRAELAEAHELGELLLRHAAAPGADRALQVQAHYGQGTTLFHMGTFDAACAHLEQALAGYDPASHAEHARVYGGYDPGVACTMWLGWTLALLGRLEEAASREREGLDLARRLAHPFSLAWACCASSTYRLMLRDYVGAARAATEAERICEEHGFPYVLGMAMANRGWAVIMQGNPGAGIPILRDGVVAIDATGAAIARPQYLGMLSAADAIEGRFDSAAARVEAALAEVERTGQRLHEVQLLIGKSRVAGNDDQAEACLRRALDVARSQGARLMELRTAVDLARHWRQRSHVAEARALLAEALAWFPNVPPAVPDVAAARRLLAELSAAT
jgi:DNA-binding winged helix-turn-helix (wHTH) protein/tetratricopeptide (TPR) repeat protein